MRRVIRVGPALQATVEPPKAAWFRKKSQKLVMFAR